MHTQVTYARTRAHSTGAGTLFLTPLLLLSVSLWLPLSRPQGAHL